MKTNIKNRKKQLLALSLSLLMASSVAGLAACTSDSSTSTSSSSSSSTTTEKDTGIITNASFKTFNTNDGKNLIGKTVTGWTRSTISNLTSTSASGIISTKTEDWDNLTGSKVVDPDKLTVEQAKAQWDNMSAKDRILFMEAWEDAHPDDKIEKELDFITEYNVDSDDLPTCENPGTAPGAEDDNVLMLHNAYDWNNYKQIGTAQKFTSSSTVTVKAGTAASVSVWVNTKDLMTSNSYGEPQPAVDKGAFISITHSVGGSSMNPVQINNINTDGEWQQYTFYLNSTAYADTTFTVVFGLGQGSSDDRWGHVSGYAFFDEIECEIITREEFADAEVDQSFNFEHSKEERVIDNYATPVDTLAIDYFGAFSAQENYLDSFTADAFKVTTETGKHGDVYTAADVEDINVYPGLGLSTEDVITAVFNNAEAMKDVDNKLLQQVYADYFEGKDFLKDQGKNEQILMLMSPSGVAYTADTNDNVFQVPAGEFMAISFFVKTSDMNGVTGAGVTLHHGNNKYSLTNLDTSDITPVEIGDNEDVYTGWQQCLFYVKNATESAQDFRLSFSFGPTTVIGLTKSSFYTGFAAFAGFETLSMSEAQFASAQSGTFSTIVTLNDEVETSSSSTNGFDTAATVPTDAIESGFADPRNYRGVYTNNVLLGGTESAIHEHPSAGLLNKDYADAEKYQEILTAIGGEGATWKDVFGNATQPLVIYNEKAQENAYGYLGATKTFSASNYATVSLRMKVSAGATANVYLIDMDNLDKDALTYNSTLSIGSKIVYWYNDDGDVCTMDPSDEHYDKDRHVALKLQDNGLYTVNAKWEGYKAEYEGKYFANLKNYEEDEAGNKLIAKDGVSYDYNDKHIHDGNDGIAYYYKNGKYYAYSNYTTEVSDFSDLAISTRYTAENSRDLSFTIVGTEANEANWITVTFYIHTGNVAKNYRLEIWSGARDNSVKNGEGSYIIIDANNPNNLDATSFADNMKDRNAEGDFDTFDSVFSFYDNAKFLRYDETLDKNDVGNSYDNYLSSSKTAGTAYLKYITDTVLELYADYQYAEDSVSVDPAEDVETDDNHDHSEETETNPWLLGSSIVIAAVLLFAVASLIIRKVVKAQRRKKGFAELSKKDKKENSDKE